MTREELAKLAIQVLEQQQRYYRSKSTAELRVSQELERKLRKEADRILRGPGLDFGDEEDTDR